MSYGHADFLLHGPRCSCGAPAFLKHDSGEPGCARCVRQTLTVHLGEQASGTP